MTLKRDNQYLAKKIKKLVNEEKVFQELPNEHSINNSEDLKKIIFYLKKEN